MKRQLEKMLKNIDKNNTINVKDIKTIKDEYIEIQEHDSILMQRAFDMEIQEILKLISKNKSIEEIAHLIDCYNNIQNLNSRAIKATLADNIFIIEEENKQIIIDSLIALKDNIKILSKTKEDEEFDKCCTDIHHINIILFNINNLYIINDITNTVEECN